MTINSVLVANRGEIARRVFHSCRERGISTVAVYSTPDAGAPFVLDADTAVHLPGTAASETYLRGDLVIAAALKAGADAIHPGYGFLSENAGFARAVQAAGLTWIGPPPEAIDFMGSKIESKLLVAVGGVPVLTELDPASVTEEQLPVLIKASAGGGGRGMRIVRALADLPAELEAARTEAASAFGDGTVFCEPYLETGHHVEVQVMADTHGTVWAVGERECSIQRRHQKVVEEAPSPLVERTLGMREKLFEAAVAAAKAVNYVGAGTVEFLADETGRFYFLEMNTRLQVEHPVTECTTGLDLVALQLEVAAGGKLPQVQPAAPTFLAGGSSIEVRLYAEDPASGWAPQTGTVQRFQVDGLAESFALPVRERGLRLDSSVEAGSSVSIHYDPMLAKLIAWAPTRTEAARILAKALATARIHGVRTNRDLLVNILRHPAFQAGDTDTAFLGTHGLETLAAPVAGPEEEKLAALAAALAGAALRRDQARNHGVLGGMPSGWRNLPSVRHTTTLSGPAGEHPIRYALGRRGLEAEGFGGTGVVHLSADRVSLDVDGLVRTWQVAHYATNPGNVLEVDTSAGSVSFTEVERFPDPSLAVAEGSLTAPMPGAVVSVHVQAGDAVTAGQALLVLEAMKMLHTIGAPADGTVVELPVAVGQNVDVGMVLAVVNAAESAAE
ncbi:propionyl-CoA carboxylase alpha chain [Arthrobacter stackebrandtii]|uniref:Propionyl-CoA carboxylase alpha chain n=1 Tax=Arthrobacter stackebrandtii TaxID=272161 RepID=A0ABS4YXY3_9MICC|nr:biotin carboxylase N-terminal domain-containing protein [Arthrobacter stackebrandtii]MBP2413643.1 propionyl-CoA carboxylase alpha chain [Arthrobacter stackebrandtii]PYG99948.1 acetyl/propionyl-CoA carboxylase subunit alpha [Arthrobacter stackebrandtii]